MGIKADPFTPHHPKLGWQPLFSIADIRGDQMSVPGTRLSGEPYRSINCKIRGASLRPTRANTPLTKKILLRVG
jgi:hypothetical protein